MQKVICDVCGTAYPAASEQCPICGCSKPTESSSETTYTYVKGGRFSKANVRKRNKAAGITRMPEPDEENEYYIEQENHGSRGLILAVVFLILAIVAVIIYIATTVFGGNSDPVQSTQGAQQRPSQSQTEVTQATTTSPTETTDGSCTGLELSNEELVIIAAGDSVLLSAQPQPENTVDPLRFASSDPEIATVTDEGLITAVAPGEVTITVTCGNMSATCKVVCDFEEEPTEPELSGNYAMFIDGQNVETRRYKNEVTMGKNQTFQLTIKDLDTGEILEVEWVVEKPNVVSVNGNTVKGTQNGNTKITVTIGETTYTCIVRISG